MASLTVRKLDEALKAQLRIRAARNGRSVEDEVRIILREAAGDDDAPARPAAPPAAALTAPPAEEATAPRVTLIIGGGIAAYKALDLIRRLKERNIAVRCVLTRAAQQFVTPLSVSALSHNPCFTDLFDPASEFDAGHIRLARQCDLVVVAPATADLMAKMAQGHADDLATAILLATDRPVLFAPAMNPAMWSHPATRRNLAQLVKDGAHLIGPNAGEMAEAREAGVGRMSEPTEIAELAATILRPPQPKPLAGRRILITAGPTHEPIDPVRYIANRSSGKQGFAIAAAAAAAGAEVVLVSGPVGLPDPPGVKVVRVETASAMLQAVEAALPVDVAIFAAAVADWRVKDAGSQKIKKSPGGLPELSLIENPDILATISHRAQDRPGLVIGFAAETENLMANAQSKLARKGCDWIIANDVSPETGIMGGDANMIHLIKRGEPATAIDSWPAMTKTEVAAALIDRIAETLDKPAP